MTDQSECHKCTKCVVVCQTRKAMQDHYSSHFHSINLLRLANKDAAFTVEQYDAMIEKSRFLKKGANVATTIPCKACRKTFFSQGSYDTHARSKSHRENLTKKAAENLRRLKIQLSKEKPDNKTPEVISVTKETTVEGTVVAEGTQYCTACQESFNSEKSYERHAVTQKHKNSLKSIKLVEKRKENLKRQDQEAEAADEDDMEVEEVDSDEWDGEEGEMKELTESQDGKGFPLSKCIFCSYKSKNLATNLSHMERTHSFFVPHKHACEIETFYKYLGEKVGVGFECIDCNRPFENLISVQKHMIDKPHMIIRFEGLYDNFFDINKIMARVQLPVNVPGDECFAFPLPDGSVLTHRNLRRFFRQRIKDSQSAVLTRTLRVYDRKSIGHLGKMSAGPGSSAVELRKEQKRITRDTNVQQHHQRKKQLAVSVKANKLQPHFRLQVQNAG